MIQVEFGKPDRKLKWMYTSLSAPVAHSPIKGRVIAYLDPLGRALRRADDELRKRMGPETAFRAFFTDRRWLLFSRAA